MIFSELLRLPGADGPASSQQTALLRTPSLTLIPPLRSACGSPAHEAAGGHGLRRRQSAALRLPSHFASPFCLSERGDSFKLLFLRDGRRECPGMVLEVYPPSANEVILRMMALIIVLGHLMRMMFSKPGSSLA